MLAGTEHAGYCDDRVYRHGRGLLHSRQTPSDAVLVRLTRGRGTRVARHGHGPMDGEGWLQEAPSCFRRIGCKQVAPPGVKWTNHIHYTGSCIALTFLFIKPATKRDLLVNPIAAGT